MKICGYCGNEYDEKEIKCPVCGSKLLKHTKGTEAAADEYRRIEEEIKNKRKSRSMILSIGVGVIALIIFIAIFSVVNYFNDPQRDIDKEAKQLYEIAVQQIKEGDYESAIETLDDIDVSWGDYSKVEGKKIEAVKGQLTDTIAQYESDGDYEAIITYINENVEDINADTEISQIYDSSVQKYKADVMTRVNGYVEKNDYASAKSLLLTASGIIGNDSEIEQNLNDIKQKEVLASVLPYENEGNYEGAINYLNQNSEIVEECIELQVKLSTYTENYRTKVLNDAKNAYETGGYDEAIYVLNSALKVLGDDSIIQNEKNRYEVAIPVKLIDLDVIKQGEYLRVGEYYWNNFEKDVNNKSYSGESVHYLYGLEKADDGEKYITYYLNQEYDVLTGTVYRPYITLSCWFDWEADGFVKIYGDGVVLYEESVAQNSLEATSFSISVTGVRELKIELGGQWREEKRTSDFYDWYPKLCVAEMEVYKEP